MTDSSPKQSLARTSKKRRRTSDVRQAVMQAALTLFAERGFHGTSIPLLAEAAGVGMGSLYHHFENKEALVNELYVHWCNTKTQFLLAQGLEDLPVREQFGLLWRRLFQFQKAYPAVLPFLELHHLAPCISEESRRVHLRGRELLVVFIAAAQKTRGIRPLPAAHLVAIVLGASEALIADERAGGVALSDEAIADVEQCLWEAVRV